MTHLFTSESVSEGHPDKVADQISDSVLDLFLTKNEKARVAVETLVTENTVVLAGEVSAVVLPTYAEIDAIVRHRISKIGYYQEGFSAKDVRIENLLHTQSADIALGVDKGGAGDQGIMFGFATNEREECQGLPTALYYAHQILKKLAEKRQKEEISGLLPDAKSQITLVYDGDKPVATDNIVVSSQHEEDLTLGDVRERILPVLYEVMPPEFMPSEDKIFINPTGRFVIGGPVGDTGVTGRKIIVDTYGGMAPHGGGAFSGKDPTKVDRSAAYMARYLAKNIVSAGFAKRCLIQLAYAIGMAEPLSVFVNTYGTGLMPDSELALRLPKMIDLTPKGIMEKLDLWRPIYTPTASYGHFGRIAEKGLFPWEKTDFAETIKRSL